MRYAYKVKQNVKFNVDVEDIFLNIETAIPCGLIINELVSNSLKYAFLNQQNGEISIKLLDDNGEFNLYIDDNGSGLPENFDLKDVKNSLGLRLVNLLVEQLEGTIELDNNNGTKFLIKFRELEYKKRF